MSLQDKLANNWELMYAESHGGNTLNQWTTLPTEFQFGDAVALQAIDPDGFRHLLIPTKETEIYEDDKSAGVHMKKIELEVKTSGINTFVDIVCLKHHLDDLFSVLTTDLLEQLDSNEVKISERCLLILEDWRT